MGYHPRVPTSSRPRQSSEKAAPGARTPASPFLRTAILILALAGLLVSSDLWLIHVRAHAGAGRSFCDIDARVSCTDVALSRFSALLGVPLAAWGALAYLTMAALSATGLRRARRSPTWPGGLLLLAAGFLSAGAVVLAAISELVLRKFCILCAASWALSFGLLALSIAAVRHAGGARAALRADLETLGAHPKAAAAFSGAIAALAAALLVGHALAPVSPAKASAAALPVGPSGSLVIYEYSDYLCPFCASMHAREKSILARRPDVRLVRRYFPLDASCNPRLPSTVHEGACDLARGGICAEKQGRFEAYDDAAFANQSSHLEPEEIARLGGLDLDAFRACLVSPETQERLAADILSGTGLGIRGTPTFIVQGKVESAEQFEQLLGLAPKAAGR